MSESEPLTPEKVQEITGRVMNMLGRVPFVFYSAGQVLAADRDLATIAADWKRLHALHTLSPADQQRVAEIRERLSLTRSSLPSSSAFRDDLAWLLGLLERGEVE